MNRQNNWSMVALGFYLFLAIMVGIGILSFVSTRELIRYSKLLSGGPLSFVILILIFYCLKREIAAGPRTAKALHFSEEWPNPQNKRILGSVALDFTQRRAAEAALQWTAQELRMVVNNIPVAVFKGYVDGTVDFFDDRVERLTGYSRQEFETPRRPWQDLIFPQDWATAKASFVKALKGSGLYVREYRIRTKAEEVVWVQERSTIRRKPDGKVDYVCGVIFDITARKRGEEAIRDSEAQFRNIFDNAVEGIFQSTVAGGYISVNPAMAEMFGYGSAEELMEAVTDIQHQVYVDPARRKDFQRLIERDGFIKNFECQVYRKDHSILWLSKNARGVRDETGNLLYYEGFAENITARKSAEIKLRRANRALKTLSAVNHALACATVEYTFLQDICRIITEVGGYRLAWVAQAHHDSTKAVSVLAYAGIEADYLEDLAISWADNEKGREPTGTAIRTNQTIIVKDVVDDPSFASWREKILNYGLASVISLPLALNGAPWCALTIYAPEVNAFDSDEVVLLEELAQNLQYGIISLRALKARQRAESALRESEEKFRGLFETSSDVVVQIDLNLNFLMVSHMAEPLFGCERATQLIGASLLDLVDPTDRPRFLGDARKLLETGTFLNGEYTFVRKDGTSFFGEVSAALTVDSADTPKAFTGTIRDITERKQAEKSLKESYERLQASLEGTVTALSAVVESKDPYTAGHQRRVTHLACAIAREMGLSQDQIEGIRVMGYLHDIGKIAVPAEILSRPGKINQFEFNLIKQHPISGFDIIKQISFPWPVAQAVFQHHERLDGSGYPTGLTDREIILEARVLAVADVVEAMASHRPYRPALDIQLALVEITQNKGTLYDSEAVEACLRLFNEKNYEFD
jgi:PAS domain S-box-containing protein/putative nucleotidyltransferase with HDIG domain